eukprot:scaffold8297_cov107-Skeletonema_dohrnii-CCMP3373.AAC.2
MSLRVCHGVCYSRSKREGKGLRSHKYRVGACRLELTYEVKHHNPTQGASITTGYSYSYSHSHRLKLRCDTSPKPKPA